MAEISVVKMNETQYEVTVQGRTATRHIVTVPEDFAARLAGGVVVATLVERSFAFLLQREPNTSILRSFELPVIGRYFPEYEQTMRGML